LQAVCDCVCSAHVHLRKIPLETSGNALTLFVAVDTDRTYATVLAELAVIVDHLMGQLPEPNLFARLAADLFNEKKRANVIHQLWWQTVNVLKQEDARDIWYKNRAGELWFSLW
jgi:hypothetical protein